MDATFHFSKETSAPMPDLGWAVRVVWGALAVCAILLCLTRVHAGRSPSWSALFGVIAAVLVSFPIGSPARDSSRLTTGIALLAACGGLLFIWTPLLLFSRKERRPQRAHARWVLALGILLILATDASLNGENIGSAAWWKPLCRTTAFLSVIYIFASPFHLREVPETVLGLVMLWAWAAFVVFIPWNRDKHLAMNMRGLMGAPIAEVRARLADHIVSAKGEGDRDLKQGLVRDLDEATLAQTTALYIYLVGGCRVVLEDGHVSRISVNWD